MRIGTLFRYLIGNRQAIQEIAADPWALGPGLLFVLSAALARDYDGEDLFSEPWRLLLPLGASVLSSLILFTLAFGLLIKLDEPRPSFLAAYRSFLGLFWMTAPLAWLYAIPYERFLSPVDAAEANLWTLAVVACWRVLLMIRVLMTLMGYGAVAATFLVMVFADGVALTLLYASPLPVIQIMGGIRLSDRDRLVQAATRMVCLLATCSLPVWVLGAKNVYHDSEPTWQTAPSRGTEPLARVRSLWVLACCSVAVWGLFLPFTQPEQQLRGRVERAFREGRTAEALAEMSAHAKEDFPPHWQPPPNLPEWRADRATDQLLEIWDELLATEPADWVRQVYLEKLWEFLRYRYYWAEEDPPRVGRLLSRLPEGPALVEKLPGSVAKSLRPFLHSPTESATTNK